MIGNWEAIFREKVENEQRLMKCLNDLVVQTTIVKWRQRDEIERLRETLAEVHHD